MNTNNFLVDFLENDPPYKKRVITPQEWRIPGIRDELIIEAYCEECDKIRSFKSESYQWSSLHSFTLQMCNRLSSPGNHNVFDKEDGTCEIILTCTHCGAEHRVCAKYAPDYIIKYGQYPSYASGKETEIIKYKNILPKYYIELKRSVNAYSQHMGIAAFVYLRRILEHLVDKEYTYLDSATAQPNFDDKLKAVDAHLKIIPPELNSVRPQIYSVLSKGVHEYDEDECYDLYPAMQYIITKILDRYLFEKQEKKKLSAITQLLRKQTQEDK